MSGIYLHIPFCKKACHYCDFHFSTSLQQKEKVIAAVQKEIWLSRDFLEGESIETIYFGGGTPSLLSETELKSLLNYIGENHDISPNAEITLEANPDDLSRDKLAEIKQAGINRLSIGIQSFFEEDLLWMNRSHSAQQASECLEDIAAMGFKNFNLDLIYGFPLLTDEKWFQNISKVLSSGAKHLSAYSLTVEPGTALFHQINKGKTPAVSDIHACNHYEILLDEINKKKGWEQYEISNFCYNKAYSKHNTSYWTGKKYLGIGPSAHSFSGKSRYWNIANNMKYVESINSGIIPHKSENIDHTTHYNETVMTALRTKWGINPREIEKEFGSQVLLHLLSGLKKYEKYVRKEENGTYVLNREGQLLADHISSELFLTDL